MQSIDDRLDRVRGRLGGVPDAVAILVREQVLQAALDQIAEFVVVLVLGLAGLHTDEGFYGESGGLHAPGSAPAIKGRSVGFQVPVDGVPFAVSKLKSSARALAM